MSKLLKNYYALNASMRKICHQLNLKSYLVLLKILNKTLKVQEY
jgi:hypothetical protein